MCVKNQFITRLESFINFVKLHQLLIAIKIKKNTIEKDQREKRESF